MLLLVCQCYMCYERRLLISELSDHRDWYHNAGILHRDISPMNVLIDITSDAPTGFLCDWDLCEYTSDIKTGPTQPGGRSVS